MLKHFPVERYKFIINDYKKEVYAISTYCKKTVKGVAKCSPEDDFDIEKGKALAAARCNMKIAKKRVEKLGEAKLELINKISNLEKELKELQKLYMQAMRRRFNSISDYEILLDMLDNNIDNSDLLSELEDD